MNSFGRAIKLALAHRANVLGCVLTACAVALLWGGNLTAVWPVVDVIMNDSSLPQWVDQKIVEGNKEIADNEQWLTRLDQLQSKDPEEISAAISAEIEHCQTELADHIEKSSGVWNDIQIAEKTR